jgi:hypothetical protein
MDQKFAKEIIDGSSAEADRLGAFTTAVARAQFLAGLDYAIGGRHTVFGAVRLDTTFFPEDNDIATQRKLYTGFRLRF